MMAKMVEIFKTDGFLSLRRNYNVWNTHIFGGIYVGLDFLPYLFVFFFYVLGVSHRDVRNIPRTKALWLIAIGFCSQQDFFFNFRSTIMI